MKHDQQLQEQVMAELGFARAVNPAQIGVTATGDVVTLTGTVDTFMQKLLAVEAAERVSGVRGVANEIEVKLASFHQRTDTEIAQAALVRGDIDLYPEYTGTALIDVLKLPMQHDAAAIYDTVKSAYEQKFQLTWLDPAPFNDSQGLATTKAIAAKYNLKTLSDLSRVASQLRLGSIPEFIKRPDALPGLQKAYGGFVFKDIKLFDIGLKYKALLSGAVDVVVAFTTEGALSANNLVVLVDDKHFWPTYQVAPVVRQATLKAMPAIATHLNKIAPNLSDATMRELNNMVDGTQKRDAADVAREFVKTHGLI